MRVLEFDEKVWVLCHSSGHCAAYTLRKVKGLATFRLRDAASEFYNRYGGESPYILSHIPMSEAVKIAMTQDCEVFYIEEYEFTDPGLVTCGVMLIVPE